MSAFLQPWMLWGMGLAAVPIVIHLLNRRRYQTVRWAAMEFLRAAFRKNQKRLRYENLLLLILRTALIVLLVLALSRPFLSGGMAQAFGGGAVHYTVVLDNSYSMGLNEGVTTPFDRAVEEAVRLAGSLRPEDSFTLYLTNDNFLGARPGIARAVLRDKHEAEQVRTELRKMRLSSGTSDFASVLAIVSEELPAKVPGKEVVIFTDFQRLPWESAAPDTSADEGPRGMAATERTIRDLLEDIGMKGAALHLVDVGASLPENVAITSFGPVAARPLVEGGHEPFQARVANYGRRTVTVDVRFSVDDRHKGSVTVTVPGARTVGDPGEADARFTFPDLDPGPHAFLSEIATDALVPDDRRCFVGVVRERIRVLAVDGDPAPTDGGTSETFFLKPAIALLSDRIDMEDVDPIEFSVKDLAGYDLVILANVERLRDDRVAALEKFVADGGGLVVFLGDKVDPALLTRSLGKDGEGLLPGRLVEAPVILDPAAGGVKMSLRAPPHPLFTGILGPEGDPEGLWESPRVWTYYKVVPTPDDDRVSVLLRLEDAERSPALLEKRFGKGGVLFWTTTADAAWGDLPSAFVIPILWHEAVYYLTAHDPADRNLIPFGAYVRELPERIEEILVTTPSGDRVKVAPILEKDKPPRLEFRDTEEPGTYQAVTSVRGATAIDAATKRTTELFAVNVDAREGDVRRITPMELQGRYPESDLRAGPTYATAVGSASLEPESEIWKALLAAVLAILFLEIFLARRFGDYARKFRGEEVAS